MAEKLSKEELDKLIQTKQPISVTDYTQEDEEIDTSSDLGKSVEAFATGGFNQFNILPNIAGVLSATKLDKLIGHPLPNADKMTAKERFDLAKKIATYNSRKMEDENPVAYNLGNLAGGVAMSAIPVAGQFTSGAGLVNKGLSAAKAGKALTGGEKLLANTLGNAVEGAAQGYAFSRDDDTSKDVAMSGAIGGAIPLAGSVLKKVGGKVAPAVADFFMGSKKKPARLYKERVKEIKQQRAEGTMPVEETEEALNSRISENRTNYNNEVVGMADEMNTRVHQANLDTQRETNKIIKDMKAERKKLQDEISSDSTKGWNELTEKQVDVTPMIEQIDEELGQRIKGMSSDYDDLANMKQILIERGTMTERDLKHFLNALGKEAFSGKETVKYTAPAKRVFRKTYSLGRDILAESNPEYGKKAKALSDKVKLSNAFDDQIDLDNVDFNSFRNYDVDVDMQDGISLFEELTGKNYKGRIISNNEAYETLKPFGDIEKIQDKLLNAKENSTDLKLMKRLLKKVDDKFGTKFDESYSNIRAQNDIPLSEEMEKLVVEKNGKTKFRKGMEKLDFEEVKNNQTASQKFFEGDESLELNKKRVDDKYARSLIDKVAKYLKQDPKKLARKIENARIENALEYGDPSGSKNVNVGIQLGKALAQNLGIPADSIASIGGLLGKEADKGRLSRAYKRIIDLVDDVQLKMNDPTRVGIKNPNRVYEGSIRNLAPTIERMKRRNEEGDEIVNSYTDNYTDLQKTQSILDQKRKNKEAWGRE